MIKHCAVIVPFKAPHYIGSIVAKLEISGITSKLYNWDSVDDNSLFDVAVNPVIIIADAESCPAFMPNLIEYYLANGGRIVTLGGPPFKKEFYSINNHEVDYTELSNRLSLGEFDKAVILPFDCSEDIDGFEKNTYNPDSKKYEGSAYLSIFKDPVTLEKCMRYYTDDFSINESFEKKISIKKGHNVLAFWAKAFENTRTITISLIEDSGNMFKARITPSANFEYFMLSKKDFVYDCSCNGSCNRNGGVNGAQSKPDTVNLSRVDKIQFGHALSHSYSVAGEHCFFIGELSSGCISVLNDNPVSIDGVCPEYRFYPVTNAARVSASGGQAVIPQSEFSLPRSIFSLSPRAKAVGIDKSRRFRFIPLIEAFDGNNLHCGYLAYMLLNFSYGEYLSSVDSSAIVAFTTADYDFFQSGGDDAVVSAVNFLFSHAMLLEGGSDEYIYLENCENAIFGAVILVKKGEDISDYRVKIQLNNVANIYSADEFELIKSNHRYELQGYDLLRVAFNQPPLDCDITVSLLFGENICDTIVSSACIYHEKPEENRHFAHIKKGENEIFIGCEPVRFFGINYMPSANTGMDTWDEFEHYTAGFAYDPDIIETDLIRIADIGINSVSVFMHYKQSITSNNILHLISLCRKHGLYVNLSLRPNADPLHFNENEVREMLEKYRFFENDTIVSYDIAWERYVGTYNECYGNFFGRKMFDQGFREFLLNRYGSFEAAEKLFICELPRNNYGEVVGPSDDMLRHDSEYTMLVAAFRRYIDSAVAKAHIQACSFIKAIDPNHLITARSGDASTIPLVDPGIYGYDYKALSLALDFMSPESYALTDNYKNMRQGVFTNIYARYANPDNVIQWLEFGKSVWTGSNFNDNSKMLKFQADFYLMFFEMLLLGHTSGLYAWWFAGGYRIGENSDFGIVSPDGSDRLVTKIFRDYAKKFLSADRLPKPTYQISIDRDRHSSGLLAMYLSIENELFEAIGRGEAVEFVDAAYTKTSADVDLLEVGNVAEHGFSPKHLSSIVTSITAILDNGNKISLKNGDELELQKSKAVTFMFELINCEKATWLSCDSYGGVSLQSLENSLYSFNLPLYSDVKFREYAHISIAIGCEQGGLFSCCLKAKDRSFFGERINILLK